MDSIILITDKEVSFQELFVKLRAKWPNTYTNALERIVVEDEDDHVFVDVATHAAQEYDPEDLEKIRKLIPSPRFFTIDYRDRDFIKRVLLAIVDDPRFVVDNDAGVIMPGPDFARRLREDGGL